MSLPSTLQGSCGDASTGGLPKLSPALATLGGTQCILLGQNELLPILSPNIWIDNLYPRALFENAPVGLKREEAYITLAGVPPYKKAPGTATRYMTNMKFQGDNAGPTVGVFGDERPIVLDNWNRPDVHRR